MDEAHLCSPFEALLRQISDSRNSELGPASGDETITPPFRVIPLSATERNRAGIRKDFVFGLIDQVWDEFVIRQRLTVRKRLQVTKLADARLLVMHMADWTIALGIGDPPTRVIV
ncbi:MAG: hypothetical protein OXE86_00880 [Alphaproteobacteria bacterium]|nr:hypothetical protein [Alphaproteobacteria bacterium]